MRTSARTVNVVGAVFVLACGLNVAVVFLPGDVHQARVGLIFGGAVLAVFGLATFVLMLRWASDARYEATARGRLWARLCIAELSIFGVAMLVRGLAA